MNVRTLLKEEIQNEFGELKQMKLGSDEYKVTVDGVTKLADRLIELEKFDFEREEKLMSRENETDLQLKQMKGEQRDRWIKDSIAVAGIVLPLVVAVWGTKASFEFEKEGTITTIMGRGFIQKLLPKK